MRVIFEIDPKTLPNKSFSWKKAYRYAKLMEQGVEFPPVQVYNERDSGNLSFNDGRHRVAASKLIGKKLKVRKKICNLKNTQA